MPENPLLPNAKLQQLYTLMLRARDAVSIRTAGLEAIFATLAQQLEGGDAVLPFVHAAALGELMQPRQKGGTAAAVLAPSSSPLAFAAGVAAGAQLAGSQRLVVALLDIRKPEPNWADLLDHIQRDSLPLILLCLPNATEKSGALTWAAMERVAKKLRFPVLTVDGGDAVAMSRALQESVIRTRHNDGPALLWCLTQAGRRTAGQSPVERLERYLDSRKIALPRPARKRVTRSSRTARARS